MPMRAARAGRAGVIGAPVARTAVVAAAGYRYRVDYSVLDAGDYRVPTAAGAIEAKIVILAAGTMGTPVILPMQAGIGIGPWPQSIT